jgi:hypothetical protein
MDTQKLRQVLTQDFEKVALWCAAVAVLAVTLFLVLRSHEESMHRPRGALSGRQPLLRREAMTACLTPVGTIGADINPFSLPRLYEESGETDDDSPWKRFASENGSGERNANPWATRGADDGQAEPERKPPGKRSVWERAGDGNRDQGPAPGESGPAENRRPVKRSFTYRGCMTTASGKQVALLVDATARTTTFLAPGTSLGGFVVDRFDTEQLVIRAPDGRSTVIAFGETRQITLEE